MSLYEIEEHTGAMIAESELPSDAMINACRADAEKWISEKYQASVLSSASASKETTKNNYRTKPAGHQEKHRPRPDGPRERRPEAPKERRPEAPKERRPEAPRAHTKPAQPITNSTPPASKNVENTNNPLLQRMLKKLLGK